MPIQSAWQHEVPKDPTTWPGGIRCVGDKVVGEWFCLARDTGTAHWRRGVDGANYIAAISDGVVLGATLGPGRRPKPGACGVDLASGDVIWSNRSKVSKVEGRNFVCANGEVREIATGRKIDKGPKPTSAVRMQLRESGHWRLVETTWGKPPVRFDEDLFVSLKNVDGHPGAYRYFATSGAGKALWDFSLDDHGWTGEAAEVERSECPRLIYFVASREKTFALHEEGKPQLEFLRCRRHLLVFDVKRGQLVQELDLGEWKGPWLVDDADRDGVVLWFDRRLVWSFARSG